MKIQGQLNTIGAYFREMFEAAVLEFQADQTASTEANLVSDAAHLRLWAQLSEEQQKYVATQLWPIPVDQWPARLVQLCQRGF